MRNRTPMRVLLTIALTLALLPMLSTFAPGGQVAGFTTASPAAANKVWYQSVGRASATAACEKSTSTDLAVGWTNWEPSWGQWVNSGRGGFVCNRHITWAFDSTPASCATGAGAANTCAVGATGPGGGIVFYVNESNATGARYLEAAPNTWSGGGTDPGIAWCSNTTTLIAGTFGTAIGTGKANTDLMVAVGACASGAAVTVRTYRGGGLSDWFLPSRDELNAMCNYSRNPTTPPTGTCTGTQDGTFAAGAFGFDDAVTYWSSSQNNAGSAWGQYFVDGGQSSGNKTNPNRVRPVRAF